MKAKALVTPTPSWPAGVPFFDAAPYSQAAATTRPASRASVGPIELRIGGSDGPSAIAILE